MHSRRSSAGFSLLEVIIALGLTVVLMTAIYGAIRLQIQFNSAGRGEVAYAQLRRGLVRQMNVDLGSIVLAIPAASTSTDSEETGSSLSSTTGTTSGTSSQSSTSSSTTTSSSTSTSTSDTTTEDPGELILGGTGEGNLPTAFGLFGTADLMHLTVSQPQRDLDYLGPYESESPSEARLRRSRLPPRAGDLMVVTWGTAPLGGLSVALQMKHQRPPDGVGRRAADLYSFDVLPSELEQYDLLASELTEIHFRYFDGYDWLDTWDSRVSQTLPTAIEVTFGFWNDPPPDRTGKESNLPGQMIPVIHVFHLPRSTPASTESL